MTAMPLWALPILIAQDLWMKWAPQKYGVPGTRVRYSYSHPADRLLSDRDYGHKKSGTGTIVDIEREYIGPRDRKKLPIGTYVRNAKFPRGYIVQPDDDGDLVCVPIDSAELLSGYRTAIPGLTEKSEENARIGDLPAPLKAYPGDMVRLNTDAPHVERRVGNILFTSRGEPVYEVFMTCEEVRLENERRKEEARIHNENRAPGDDWERGYVICEESDAHAWLRQGQFVSVRKGNLFYLNNGTPEDLHFSSLDEEVDFFAHQAGEWLNDTHRPVRVRYEKDAAIAAIEKGSLDLAIEMLDNEFTPIRILPRYEKFRARARKAALEHLRSL